MKNIELRMNNFDVVQDINSDKLTVSGYVNETGKQSELLGHKRKFKEIIQKGAFARALEKGKDVMFLAEHDENKILASTRNNSLTLKEDEKGLYMEAEISPTSYGKDYHQLIKDGIIRNMSFGFSVNKDSWTKKDGINLRTVEDLDLFEVSAVTYPAYTQSSISARGLNVVEDIVPNENETEKEIDVLNTTLNIVSDVSTLLRHKVLDAEKEKEFRNLVNLCSEIVSEQLENKE